MPWLTALKLAVYTAGALSSLATALSTRVNWLLKRRTPADAETARARR
jgi:hypothetical protein